MATFTVSRTRGTVGLVEVYWEVSEANAESDLAPASGTLVFPEGVTVQNFSIRALGDNAAEGFETFTVTLVSASNGGRVFGTTQANIGIPTSDDPSGVVQFGSYPEGIVVMEGDQLTARCACICVHWWCVCVCGCVGVCRCGCVGVWVGVWVGV